MQTAEKYTFREGVALTIRGYKLWWKKIPSHLVASTLYSLVSTSGAYIGIFITARLINEIAGDRNRERLIFWVVMALASALALGLVTAILNRW
ncbi:MAG: ABC transporter ATP-binding protein, partial [Defluviitaleaceae bacterium]|nr:ABC transporter ATP-binding protein [Defluviitaleaceae bacterium]